MNDTLRRECMDPKDSFCHHGCPVGAVCAKHAEKVKTAPYPFCAHPWKCVNGRCEREYCCAD